MTFFLTTALSGIIVPILQTGKLKWGVTCPGSHRESVAEGGLENSRCLTCKSGFSGPARPLPELLNPLPSRPFGFSLTLRLTLLVLPRPWARSGQLRPPQGLGRKHRERSEVGSSPPTLRLDPGALPYFSQGTQAG